MTMRRADKVVVQFSIMQKGLDCYVISCLCIAALTSE